MDAGAGCCEEAYRCSGACSHPRESGAVVPGGWNDEVERIRLAAWEFFAFQLDFEDNQAGNAPLHVGYKLRRSGRG